MECEERLRQKGFNIKAGTFGTVYGTAPLEPHTFRVHTSESLPNASEQNIVVVNTGGNALPFPRNYVQATAHAEWDLYNQDGYMDPRPLIMKQVSGVFDRIFDAGGCFVIFANPRTLSTYVSRRSLDEFGNNRVHATNWAFLSILGDVTVDDDNGQEFVVNGSDPISNLLRNHLSTGEGEFFVTFKPRINTDVLGRPLEDDSEVSLPWQPLAKSIHGDCVAAVIHRSDRRKPASPRVGDIEQPAGRERHDENYISKN